MYGSIRRVSRFASSEELREPAKLLAAGEIVAVPGPDGMLLATSLESAEILKTISGTEPLPLVSSFQGNAAHIAAPARLLHWLDQCAGRAVLDITLPASDGGPPARVRAGCHPAARSLFDLAAVPIVTARARGKDGAPLRLPADVMKRYREDVDMVMSVRGADEGEREASGGELRVTLLAAGLAVEGFGTGAREPGGSAAQASAARLIPAKPLFVCLGNLNRSAICEALIRAKVAECAKQARHAGLAFVPAYAPTSAGTVANPETRVPGDMIAAAARMGCGDLLLAHVPRMYTPALLGSCDEVVPVDSRAATTVRDFGAGEVPVTFSKSQDLPDPMGGAAEGFYAAAETARTWVEREFFSVGCPLSGAESDTRRRARG